MKLLKNITPLTKKESENIKGGYIFSCEEKKRNLMLVSVYSDTGRFLQSYKVAATTAETFITNFRL